MVQDQRQFHSTNYRSLIKYRSSFLFNRKDLLPNNKREPLTQSQLGFFEVKESENLLNVNN